MIVLKSFTLTLIIILCIDVAMRILVLLIILVSKPDLSTSKPNPSPKPYPGKPEPSPNPSTEQGLENDLFKRGKKTLRKQPPPNHIFIYRHHYFLLQVLDLSIINYLESVTTLETWEVTTLKSYSIQSKF